MYLSTTQDLQLYLHPYRIINNKLWTAEDEARANQVVQGRSLGGDVAPREGRVLNVRQAAHQVGGSSSSYPVQYPSFYMERYHNNERTGVVAEDSFEDDSTHASSEQVVSYSYRAAPQGDLRDVVYGSGAAAKPPSSGHTFSARSPSLTHTALEVSQNPPHTTHNSPIHGHFESSKLKPISVSSVSHPSHSSDQFFFPTSFSSSPLITPSPSPPSLPPVSQFTHPDAIFSKHQPAAATVYPADPSHFIIKDSTFQAFPGAPTFSVPLPIPHNQITSHPVVANDKREQLAHAGSSSQSSYVSYHTPTTTRPIYQRVMDPFRRVGERIYKVASPVFKPMMDAGHRLSERLQLDKRMSAISESLRLDTVDSEALPVVAGVSAITAIGLAVLAIAAANNATVLRKRSIDDVPALHILDQLRDDEGGLSTDKFEEFFVAPLMANASSSSPWCSKRVICDVMTYLSDHYLYEFEKELQLFLKMLNSGQSEESSLRQTAHGFLTAVKEGKCNQYTCGDEQVDTSQILTGTSGPR